MNSQWLGNYWTADDMNGNTHVLQNHVNEGKAVLVDISAHWCPPCYSLHESHSMANVYHDFGPDGTDEVMVFLTDVDAVHPYQSCKVRSVSRRLDHWNSTAHNRT